jgi:REP element-mobilizing transposase RayT
MPRRARIDAAGALHHIICRGIERRKIFRDDADREEFLERLGRVLKEAQSVCYAWALIPNHFHLLLRTGSTPIKTVMQRLLSGYAGAFNRRHRRIGQIFHNRYKSILCQQEPYLLELVGYIHLNPLRSRLVEDLDQLDSYPYSGHSALMGRCPNDWQDVDTILRHFGSRQSSARNGYRWFVEKALAMGRRSELTGGGLIRSLGGWGVLKRLGKGRVHLKGDERILGDSDFVEAVLDAQNEKLERRYRLEAKGFDIEKALKRAAEISGLTPEQIRTGGKEPWRVQARSLACYWAVRELGMTTVAVSKALGIGPTAVTKAVSRGEVFAKSREIRLEK